MRALGNKLAMAVTMAFVLVSCGGKGGLKPQTTKIAGPLGDYFEVVDRTYNLREDGSSTVIFAEITRVKEGGPKDASWTTEPTFILSILDSNGDVLDTDETNVVSEENELETVFGLRVGESSTIPFHFGKNKAVQFKLSSKWAAEKENGTSQVSTSAYESSQSSVLVTGTNVRLRIGPGLNYDPITDAQGNNIHPEKGDRLEYLGAENDFFKVRYAGRDLYISQQFSQLVDGAPTTSGPSAVSTSSSYSSSSDSYSSSGSTDWDAVLDSFEKYVDDYVAMMKKAANGDPTAITKYPSLLKNAEDLQRRLENADDELSPAQMSRYMKIVGKMSSAAVGINLDGISSTIESLGDLFDNL